MNFRAIRTRMVLLVFVTMVCASLMTSFGLLLLYRMGLIATPQTDMAMPFLLLVASIIIGTVLSFIFSSRILKPVNALIDATKKVAKGDFSVRVAASDAETELDRLINSFNSMTEELASTELFKRDFINIFSHEFKTPIVSIRGFARQLKNESLSPELRREYTDIIISESERMAKMSGNILLLTKLENQQFVGDKCIFSLDEQLRSCILLLEADWQKKDIDWQLELEVINYYGNEELCTQLWVNLLSNAVKYSRDGSPISVRCYYAGQMVRVVIADMGIGIEPLALQHIFDKFYQVDSSHSSEGNGLGLAIVRRIVEIHGGHITVESELGKGTSFYVDLPIEKQV